MFVLVTKGTLGENVNWPNLALAVQITIATPNPPLPLDVANAAMNATNKGQEKEDAAVRIDSEDDFKYEEVYLEDDWSLTEGEEDLEATVKAIQNRAETSARAAPGPNAISNTHRPEAVDDFFRNFLIHAGMTETLDCFQAEWTEKLQKGLVDAEQVGVVPDVYIDNQRLENKLKNAQREREEYRLSASAAAETLERVQRARDLHRLQHKRVVQEKNRLVGELRKLKVQSDNYEPAVRRVTEKYQAVLRQTTVVSLERDKVVEQVKLARHNISLCGDAGEHRLTREESQESEGQPVP